MYREHPVKILRYCTLNLWLLLLPLVRSLSLLPFSPEAFIEWLSGAWFDIMVLLFIIGSAVLRWYRCSFYCDDERFTLISGIFFQKHISIPYSQITAVTESEIRLPFMFRLSVLKIDTKAAEALPETKLWLRKKDFIKLAADIPIYREKSPPIYTCRTGAWRILLYSFLFSSSLSGTLYVAAFFIQAGKSSRELLLKLHAAETLNEMSNAAASVFHVVPKIIITLLIILAMCWLLSFVVNLLRGARFTTALHKEQIRISAGLLPRRHICIRTSSKEHITFRQTLMCKFTGRTSVLIGYPGSGKERKSGTLLVPIIPVKNAALSDPEWKPKNKSCAHRKGLWSFIWQPVLLIAFIMAVLLLSAYLKPYAAYILFPLSGIALIPTVTMLLIRLIAYGTQYIAWDEKSLSAGFSRGFSFYTVKADIDNIALVKILQTPMAEKQGFCNVTLYLRGKRTILLRGQKTQKHW